MLGRMKVEVAGDITMQQRTAGHHLGVDHGVAGELTKEKAAMPIRPVHHGSGAQPMRRHYEGHQDRQAIERAANANVPARYCINTQRTRRCSSSGVTWTC